MNTLTNEGYLVLSLKDLRRITKIVKAGKAQAETNGSKRPNYCHVFTGIRVLTDVQICGHSIR